MYRVMLRVVCIVMYSDICIVMYRVMLCCYVYRYLSYS